MMIIKNTKSLCPQCLKVVDAEVYEDNGKIMIKKTCPEHGEFDNTYWGNSEEYFKAEDYGKLGNGIENPQTIADSECPQNCGLCDEHESHTVLGLIDVTNRCNLKCPVCFANAAVSKTLYEPTYEEIRSMLQNLRNNEPVPAPAIQFAGGEPTVRKDLVELIKLAKEEGFSHTQIATNGLRIARLSSLAKDLKEAGLNTVYLQFDGITEEPYIKMRNRDLLAIKLRAIENCREAGLGIVLVPTILKGINHDQIGDIIRFAAKNIDIIRGVNFQPVSFAGRTPADEVEAQRITIPDFTSLVQEQTDSEIREDDFYPASCVTPVSEFIEAIDGKNAQVTFTCHPHCGTATYVFIDGDGMVPITRFIDVDRFFNLLSNSTGNMEDGGLVAKAKILARASVELPKTVDMKKSPSTVDLRSILVAVFRDRSYKSLGEFHHKALLISCMHFMDPFNFDQDRVKRCVIHYAVPDGRIIPFCSMNAIYRPEIEGKFSKPFVPGSKINQ